MNEMKLANYVLVVSALIFCTMFVWIVNCAIAANNMQIPMAISAFNG